MCCVSPSSLAFRLQQCRYARLLQWRLSIRIHLILCQPGRIPYWSGRRLVLQVFRINVKLSSCSSPPSIEFGGKLGRRSLTDGAEGPIQVLSHVAKGKQDAELQRRNCKCHCSINSSPILRLSDSQGGRLAKRSATASASLVADRCAAPQQFVA